MLASYRKLLLSRLPSYSDGIPFASFAQSLSAELYEQILAATQYLPGDKLDEIQRELLASIIKYARNHVPFYREYLESVRTIEDFDMLPPVSKERMRQEFDKKTVIAESWADFGLLQFTSGSTGVPFRFFLDKRFASRALARYRRMTKWCGRTETDSVVRLMPRDFFGHEDTDTFLKCADPEDLKRQLPALLDLWRRKSIILLSRTSHLTRLAQLLEPLDTKPKFKALISCAEQLYPNVRRYIERVLNAPVFNYYGSNETTAIGFECQYHDGFHVQSELVYVEILGEDNRRLHAGEVGDIVVTVFDNRVMPFIRYKIGDRGYWSDRPCPCGRMLPRIYIEGRDTNAFSLPDGRVGHFASLIHPISAMVERVEQYQVDRLSPENFLLKIVPTEKFRPSDPALLQTELTRYLGPRVALSIRIIHRLEKTEGGKPRAFVNHCPDPLPDLLK